MTYWKDYEFAKLDVFANFEDGWTEKEEFVNKRKIKVKYSNTRFNLDTETTSFFKKKDGSLMMFDNQLDSDFYETTKKYGIVYIWQFCINGEVIYGRYLEELKECLKEVQSHFSGMKIVIFVHNLSFDFQFLLNIFEEDEIEIFARKSRKIIYARVGSLEFRCSYFLTNMSLDTFAKSYKLPVQKLKGYLDYNVLRTPLTPLTENELLYCEHDCLVLDEIIKYHKAKHHSIVNIPLTQTGKIRSQLNHLFYHDIEHHKMISRMSPDNFEDYQLLTTIFQGGFTHANPIHSGHIIENVLSYDICSSYPFEMVTNLFSCSQYGEGIEEKVEDVDRETKKFIVDFTVRNLEAKTSNHILSYSKASKIFTGEVKKDNGRIISVLDKKDKDGNVIEESSASYILLDDDWDMFELFYKYETIKINHIYTAKKDYLPLTLIKYILELYKDKTQLKNVAGEEALYTEKKVFVNGLFGLTCTKDIQGEISFDRTSDTLWKTNDLSVETATELIVKKKKQRGRNLAFSWGPEIAAAGRRHLLEIVWKLGEQGDAEAYCDTDSHKIVLSSVEKKVKEEYPDLSEEEIIKKAKERVAEIFCEDNVKVLERIWKVIEHFGEENLSFEDFAPCDIKGERHCLGIYSKEQDILRFASLGAKKYACEYYTKEEYDIKFEKLLKELKEKNPDMTEEELLKKAKEELPFVKITVAGINKKTGSASLKKLENFRVGRFFDYDEAGKSEAYYNDNQEEVVFPDGFVSKYKYGICLKPATYFLSFGKDDEYENLLNDCLDDLLETGSLLFK